MLDHNDTRLLQKGKRDICWTVFRREVLLHTALKSTHSLSSRSKNCRNNESTSERNKSTHTHTKIIKPKDGDKTCEWLIPWSSHSVYDCRSNKPRYSPNLMKFKGALICSKQVATGCYREPLESSLNNTSYFLNFHFYTALCTLRRDMTNGLLSLCFSVTV